MKKFKKKKKKFYLLCVLGFEVNCKIFPFISFVFYVDPSIHMKSANWLESYNEKVSERIHSLLSILVINFLISIWNVSIIRLDWCIRNFFFCLLEYCYSVIAISGIKALFLNLYRSTYRFPMFLCNRMKQLKPLWIVEIIVTFSFFLGLHIFSSTCSFQRYIQSFTFNFIRFNMTGGSPRFILTVPQILVFTL